MTDTDLRVLERDVEKARARFAGDLDRLRSPSVVSGFQDDLMADARETTDHVVAKAKEAMSDGVRHVVADLKGRAAANPTAALAIGAGLAWRLAHRPPIASLLVGVGLWSLWRTGPFGRNGGFGEQASELAGVIRERSPEWSAEAREALTDASGRISSTVADAAVSAQDTVKDTVKRLKDSVVAGTSRAADRAPDALAQLRDVAAAAGQKASTALRDIAPDADTRDTVLLGAAAVAVAAAVGIAYQRRSAEEAE